MDLGVMAMKNSLRLQNKSLTIQCSLVSYPGHHIEVGAYNSAEDTASVEDTNSTGHPICRASSMIRTICMKKKKNL